MQSYLQEEENRQTKEERAYKKKLKEELLAREAGMSKKVEGADSLKEMNDIQAGMASTIIQVYIKEINMCFHSAYKPIRLCALEVLCLILNQGLIHPVQSVPYLISAATDQDHTIAVKSEKQLADIDQKYPGSRELKFGSEVSRAEIPRRKGGSLGTNNLSASRVGVANVVYVLT